MTVATAHEQTREGSTSHPNQQRPGSFEPLFLARENESPTSDLESFTGAISAESVLIGYVRADQQNGFGCANQKIICIDPHEGAILRRVMYANQKTDSLPSSTIKATEWDGVVEAIEGDQLVCKLKVAKGSDVDIEESAMIPMEHVDADDYDLLKPGAIFRLVVGLETKDGKRQQFMRMVFRRLPAWNKSSVDEEYRRLVELVDGIEWSDDSSARRR